MWRKGIDMMDCVLPSRNARNGYLFTSAGRVVIKQAQYMDDQLAARPGLRLLHLPHLLPRLSSPFIPVRRNSVLHACDAA